MNETRKQKQREYSRKYYEEHKEELRKKKNEYRKNNLDKYRKNQKKYYQNNKDYYNNYSKEWSKQKLDNLLKQLEAYESMRKELIKYIHDKFDRFDCDGNLGISMQITYCEEDLLNILNKVGGSDE